MGVNTSLLLAWKTLKVITPIRSPILGDVLLTVDSQFVPLQTEYLERQLLTA